MQGLLPSAYEKSHIFKADAKNIDALTFDQRFRNMTIIVQPLNLVSPPDVLTESLINSSTAVLESATTGTVKFTACPPKCFKEYEFPDADGEINLSDQHFFSTNIPIDKLFIALNNVTGCTHIAVTVIGHIN